VRAKESEQPLGPLVPDGQRVGEGHKQEKGSQPTRDRPEPRLALGRGDALELGLEKSCHTSSVSEGLLASGIAILIGARTGFEGITLNFRPRVFGPSFARRCRASLARRVGEGCLAGALTREWGCPRFGTVPMLTADAKAAADAPRVPSR
jgi:hypothetical protein